MDPLAELKDIHTPDVIGLWPLAYGWWLLAAFTFVLVLVGLWQWRRYRRKRIAKREALQALSELSATEDWPQQLNTLLRRVSISYFAPSKLAQLHGQAWLDFLVEQLPEKQQDSFNASYAPVLDSLYQAKQADIDFKASTEAAKQWLQHALPPKGFKLESSIGTLEASHV